MEIVKRGISTVTAVILNGNGFKGSPAVPQNGHDLQQE